MMKACHIVKHWFAICMCLLIGAGSAYALEATIISQAERQVSDNRTQLQSIQAVLSNPTISEQELIEKRTALEDIQTLSTQQAQALALPLDDLNQQIAKLGPAPAAGATEAPEIAEQRNMLTGTAAKLQGVKAQLSLIAVEAEQASTKAAALQRSQFVSRVFEPSRSILNPYLWRDAVSGFITLGERILRLVIGWWSALNLSQTPAKLLVFPALAGMVFALWWFGVQFFRKHLAIVSVRNDNPNDIERLWIIVRSLVGVVIMGILLVILTEITLRSADLLTARFELIVDAILVFVVEVALNITFIYRLAAPRHARWRVLNLSDSAASRFLVLGVIASLISGLSEFIRQMATDVYLPVNYTSGISAVLALAMLSVLILILVNFRNQPGLAEEDSHHIILFPHANVAITPTRILVFVAAFALLLGYIALSDFVIFRIFETAAAILFFYVLHCLSDAATKSATDPRTRIGNMVRRVSHLGERGIDRIALTIRTSFDVVLVIVGLPILFYIWSVTWVDFRSLVNRLSLGFVIGNVTISPWSIFMVILVFFTGVVITRLFVRWLNSRVLSETHIDPGIQDSVRTGVTYTGYILAGGIAASAAGINLSSLAIVAGALSVGIGFGLQAITSNFISGLILLAERPVRVGDWVIIASGEGIIRKINVRSTEIETFDGCSIIVPNSSLITESVRNWTRHNTIGRIGISLTVTYDSDVQQVTQILQNIFHDNPHLLSHPAPIITVSRFASYGIVFDMKAHVANISDGSSISSDLRTTIAKTFAREKIKFAVATASDGDA